MSDRADGRKEIRSAIEVEASQRLPIQYVDGACRGQATWRFEAVNGGTMLSQHGQTSSVGVLGVLAPVVPVAESHSHIMQLGIRRLADQLERPRWLAAGSER